MENLEIQNIDKNIVSVIDFIENDDNCVNGKMKLIAKTFSDISKLAFNFNDKLFSLENENSDLKEQVNKLKIVEKENEIRDFLEKKKSKIANKITSITALGYFLTQSHS